MNSLPPVNLPNHPSTMPQGAYLIPAYQAEKTLGAVLRDLRAAMAGAVLPVVVVDDGSTDRTAEVAEAEGAVVLRHERNQGKGQALQTGLHWAKSHRLTCVVTLDADGQHPPVEAVRLMHYAPPGFQTSRRSGEPARRTAGGPASPAPEESKHHSRGADEVLVLAIRDLKAAGAPRANQRSNAFSNLVLSLFSGIQLLDTQCGLRRYPVDKTLELNGKSKGYAYEAEVVLRAARTGQRIDQVPSEVIYPQGADRVTHFDSFRDPARIVGRVVLTTLAVPHHRALRRWSRRLVYCAVIAATFLFFAHSLIRHAGALTPPDLALSHGESLSHREPRQLGGGLRSLNDSYAFRRHGIWEVGLVGDPEELGWAHGRLLHDEMVATEGVLFSALTTYVPSRALRSLVLDTAIWKYREIDQGMSNPRLRELAAKASAFRPDPFAEFLPTYQRFVYLSALYDIALSFEHSPLIGCTTFSVSSDRSSSGSPMLARTFDFEVHDIFDEQKAVFFVREEGKIPFASVAWPGLVGVVTGMNSDGLAAVVHGARAGPTSAVGEPVVQTLRKVLSEARSTAEAIAILERSPKLVSHLVVLNDAAGRAVAIERVVGAEAFVKELPNISTVTNHLEGPFAEDPKNRTVLEQTSTMQRRKRGDVLAQNAATLVSPQDLMTWLRDRRAPDGRPLSPGDRRSIDALIATHAVVMSTRDAKIWVSQSPHLLGGFVEYDLRQRFADDFRLDPQERIPVVAEHPERAALTTWLDDPDAR